MKIEIESVLPKKPSPEDIISLILKNRRIDDVYDFFSPKKPELLTLADFGFEKEYIDQAMRLVWSHFGSEKPIIVYSDYDADGITGGAILWETLHTLGFKAFPYIGSRVEEGYGFSKTGLDNIKKKYDPCLVISVDHGIAASEMVRYAKYELNIPIIVTDHHHMQDDKVPKDAEAIFHIPALSGSGTAYYVAKEITEYGAKSPFDKLRAGAEQSQKSSGYGLTINDSLANLFASDYIGLAAIGTIADLVPLVGPSRAIAKYGLETLTNTKRAGIEALKRVSGNLGKTITTYEVGFMIAPRINASGRLSDALSALRLLCTHDSGKAAAIAGDLQALNTERQDMVKRAVSEAIAIVENVRDKNGGLPKILIVSQDHSLLSSQPWARWHEGIIGLIASKLVEKYHRPAIVFTKSEQRAKSIEQNAKQNILSNDSGLMTSDYFKASARSIPGFHLTDFLKLLAEYLSHFGGHAAAAGLSVSSENLPIFVEKAIETADALITDEMLIPVAHVDCELPLALATIGLAEILKSLAPFGMGNERPKFVSAGLVTNIQVFGKDNTHLRFRLTADKSSLDFIAFGKANLADELSAKNAVSLAYTLDINRWNGSEKLQAKLITTV